ncbi:hillarin-like isoform X3 [Varroa jacobsoni]|uniref:Transglutaminase-like domain-containing protein n=1 Tax=Varroa destructor TaxID=109461 RepID=A0A7M7JMH8_VARDE|nr:hillarin-like isoform X2 [Varroa destructor]XP_022701862.1 hillarin-like isoform X3 [Varroa jacobsoni]
MGCGASKVQPKGEPPRVTADWNPGTGDRPFTLGQTKPSAIMCNAETQAAIRDVQDRCVQADYPGSCSSEEDLVEIMWCSEDDWQPYSHWHWVEEIVTTTHLHLKDIGIIDAAVQTLRQDHHATNRQIQTLLHRCEKTDIEPFGQRTISETLPLSQNGSRADLRKGSLQSANQTKSEIDKAMPVHSLDGNLKNNGETGTGKDASKGEGRNRCTSKKQQQQNQLEEHQKELNRVESAEHEFSIEDVVESPTPQKCMVGENDTKALSDLEDWVCDVTSDFEGQTEPIARAPAANALGVTEEELHFIQQELDHAHDSLSQGSVQDSFNGSSSVKSAGRLLEEDYLEKAAAGCGSRAGTLSPISNRLATIAEKREIAVQTLNDVTTDEAAEFAARPPPCKKKELIPLQGIFSDIDKYACNVPSEIERGGIEDLVNYLMVKSRNDLFKVRVIFRWIANNISFEWKYVDEKLTPEKVLLKKKGVCKDYCSLFCEMCRCAGIRVKQIQGFAKGHDYRPEHQFSPGSDVPHAWNAVFLFGSWRLVDVTWGSGFTDHTGSFQRKLNEHFFLTDPEALIWTHFPYDELEANYERWQLLDVPMDLATFNSLPKVTPHFFQFSMKIRSKIQNPVEFRVRSDIRIASHEHMRFKFKLYPSEEVENSILNNYVFCHLVEDRLVGCFGITPPTEGRYYFKVYARPERDMGKDDASLQNVAVFLLNCTRARKYLIPYPPNEVPWGPTQTFYDYNMKLVNQNGPVIVSWGGKRKLQIDSAEAMLITHQVLNADGQEVDTTGMLSREDKDKRITFVLTPVRVGYFKLILFGMPKPKQKGKWRLPLIATFLIDCKLTRLVFDEELRLAHHRKPGDPDPDEDKEDKDGKKKKKKKKK